MSKPTCKDCLYFQYVAGWYYDECMAGPMITEPNDPACGMFNPRMNDNDDGERA